MNCDKTRLLNRYLDNELPSGERKLLEEHLKECPACNKALSEMKMVDQLALSIPEVPSACSFEALKERIKNKKQNAFPVPRWTIVAASVLMLAAGAFFGINEAGLFADSQPDGQSYVQLVSNTENSGYIYNLGEE